MASLPLPLPLPIPTDRRKTVVMPATGHAAEPVEVMVQELGDIEGVVVVVQCQWQVQMNEVFAEYLIARLLNLGAERVELVGCREEFWAHFVSAAERLGVPDHVRRVGISRLYGAE